MSQRMRREAAFAWPQRNASPSVICRATLFAWQKIGSAGWQASQLKGKRVNVTPAIDKLVKPILAANGLNADISSAYPSYCQTQLNALIKAMLTSASAGSCSIAECSSKNFVTTDTNCD